MRGGTLVGDGMWCVKEGAGDRMSQMERLSWVDWKMEGLECHVQAG